MEHPITERRFPVMGTTAHVMTIAADCDAIDAAQRRLVALEGKWSRFLPRSELSQLNRSPGVPVVVSAETYRLIESSIDAWRQTDGLFDPTVGVSMDAAGYDRSFERLSSTDLRSVLHRPAPGPAGIVLHPYANAVELPEGVRLDLGGIAKGAAADLVADELMAAGCHGCCVNIGGDLRAAGCPPRAEGWQVTLDCPGGSSSLTVGLQAGAICTTTRLRRRWATAEGWEHHLRHPGSGSALATGIASVTIIAARAAQAEVLTKAVFASGPAGGKDLAERYAVTGVVVLDDATVVAMPGLEPFSAAALSAVAA